MRSLAPGFRSIVSRMAFAKLLAAVLPTRDALRTRSWLYLATRRSRRQSATRVKRTRCRLATEAMTKLEGRTANRNAQTNPLVWEERQKTTINQSEQKKTGAP